MFLILYCSVLCVNLRLETRGTFHPRLEDEDEWGGITLVDGEGYSISQGFEVADRVGE